jgi:DNA polymerase III subunit epsilon
MIGKKWAFVDLETTGGRSDDRVIEVGIVTWDGEKVEEWQSLINPDRYVSDDIYRLTGIRKDELLLAPSFEQVVEEVRERLEGAIFVAHNARFDYGFIRREFARLEREYSSKVICSVKLSRKLWPEYRRHSLDTLIERWGIVCTNRHRALGDAKVIFEFLTKMRQMLGDEKVFGVIESMLASQGEPPMLPKSQIEMLPEKCGVYIFKGAGGETLYVGKSKNIKNRVQSHFYDDIDSDRELMIKDQVVKVEIRETKNEFEALLWESLLVKKMRPLYNRRLRNLESVWVIKIKNDGKVRVLLQEKDVYDIEGIVSSFGVFRNKSSAQKHLEKLAEAGFCKKVLGLESGGGACFAYHLGECKGACIGKEDQKLLELKLMTQLAMTKIQKWPFEGPVILGDGVGAIVEDWCVIGFVDQNGTEKVEKKFDLDVYKLLRAQIYKTKIETTSPIDGF